MAHRKIERERERKKRVLSKLIQILKKNYQYNLKNKLMHKIVPVTEYADVTRTLDIVLIFNLYLYIFLNKIIYFYPKFKII